MAVRAGSRRSNEWFPSLLADACELRCTPVNETETRRASEAHGGRDSSLVLNFGASLTSVCVLVVLGSRVWHGVTDVSGVGVWRVGVVHGSGRVWRVLQHW
jgi:hypothetical protein